MRRALLSILVVTSSCGGSVADDGASDAGAAVDSFVPRDTTPATDSVVFDAAPFDAHTTCPAAVPASGGACGPIRFNCTYKGACGDDFAQCVDGTWTVIRSVCGKEYCPLAVPAPGSSCGDEEGFTCEFPTAPTTGTGFADCTFCVCKGGIFYCDPHPLAECPLKSCLSGDSCGTPHMVGCEYGGKCGTSCRCGDDGKLSCPSRPC